MQSMQLKPSYPAFTTTKVSSNSNVAGEKCAHSNSKLNSLVKKEEMTIAHMGSTKKMSFSIIKTKKKQKQCFCLIEEIRHFLNNSVHLICYV